MKYQDILNEAEMRAVLFHSMKLEFAFQALRRDSLEGRTIQRFWSDGRRRKDTDNDYNDSYWFKGLSMTRDVRFAQNWGDVVLKLDRTKIANNYKIVPYNWGYSIPGNKQHKKEKEDFVVTGRIYKNEYDLKKDHEEAAQHYDHPEHWMNKVVGKPISPLHQFILDITMEEGIKEIEGWDEMRKSIERHPKFLGYYKR